jgi:hypothetical protein
MSATICCVLILQGKPCWLYQNSDCIELRANLDKVLENYSNFQIAYIDTYEERQINYFVNPTIL